MASSSSSNGQLILTTDRTSDSTKWSIAFRTNVLRVFVHTNNVGVSGATVQLFRKNKNGASDTTTTNDGGYAFFVDLDAEEAVYGITASKTGYERKSYQPNANNNGVMFTEGGNGTGSFDADINILPYATSPTLLYPLDEVCLPPDQSQNQHYGWRKHNGNLNFHKGIDISRKPIVNTGEDSEGFERFGNMSVNARPNVVSVWSGKVFHVDEVDNSDAGKYVIVGYDITGDGSFDIQVRYLHLASIEDGIEKNKPIGSGQIIGKPGETGMGTTNGSNVHLHIDISVFVNEDGVTPSPENTIDPNVFFKQE